MRSALLMLGAVMAIVAVAGVYVWMQPTVQQQAVVIKPTTTAPIVLPTPPAPPAAPGTQPLIGAGRGVWMKVPDEKVPGRIAWQSRFGEHQPRPDGSVDVTDPEAEFFMEDGGVLTIVAKRGRVVIPGEASRDPAFRGSSSPPSRGELYDVTLTLYADDTRQQTTLQCVVDNLAFDNDTLRVSTEAIRRPDGTVIPGDQVPVQVRGVEYDFDGRGLTIRWNGRDRRLQSMEIAHGQSLTRKPKPATQPAAPSTPPAQAVARPATRPARQAAATPSATPATQPAFPLVYRATFDRDVVVLEGTDPIAIADTMRFDIRPEEDDKPKSSTAEPATLPAGARAASSSAPTTAPALASARKLRGPLAPATSPSDKPFVINWTGKLTVVPITDGSSGLEPGKSAVELVSQNTPVKVTHSGYDFTAASFSYNGADDSVIARSSEQVPLVTMKAADGTDISTPSLRFNGRDGTVTLEGPSSAKIVRRGEKPEETETFTAQWQELCVLTLSSPGTGEPSIERADIRGDVRIEHPKIKELRAQKLVAVFDPLPADKAGADLRLKELQASGGVKVQVPQEDLKGSREISAESLTVTTRAAQDGRLVPYMLIADGRVHSFDEKQDVRADRVEVTLAPTTRPNDVPSFERISALGDVVFKQGDAGGTAVKLEVNADGPDESELTLTGGPAAVNGDGFAMTGPLIKVATRRQQVQVFGPGTLRHTRPAEEGKQPLNFDLAWGTDLHLDGLANTAHLHGQVHINGTTPDRGTFDATADKLVIELADPPATQPVEPTTKPAMPGAAGFDLLAKKEIRSFTLDGDTKTQIAFAGAADQGVRRVYLRAPLVKVEPVGGQTINRVTVPSAGQMLYEDLRPTTRPAEPAKAGPADIGDLSGPTAFEWSRQLVFDQTTQQATMEGDVNIVHDAGEPFRLESGKMTAHFSPPTEPTTQSTTQPVEPQIHRIVADGGVRFTSRRISFQAWQMDLDPSRKILEAIGADGAPVQIFDANGVSTGSVRQASWNTVTQAIEVHDLLFQFRR